MYDRLEFFAYIFFHGRNIHAFNFRHVSIN